MGKKKRKISNPSKKETKKKLKLRVCLDGESVEIRAREESGSRGGKKTRGAK